MRESTFPVNWRTYVEELTFEHERWRQGEWYTESEDCPECECGRFNVVGGVAFGLRIRGQNGSSRVAMVLHLQCDACEFEIERRDDQISYEYEGVE